MGLEGREEERGEKCWTVGNCFLRTGEKEVETSNVEVPHAWNSHLGARAAFEFATNCTADRVGKQQTPPAAPMDWNGRLEGSQLLFSLAWGWVAGLVPWLSDMRMMMFMPSYFKTQSKIVGLCIFVMHSSSRSRSSKHSTDQINF